MSKLWPFREVTDKPDTPMNEAPNFFMDGSAYERHMGRWSRLAGEVFLDWLALPKGLRWIDVGCGNGAFTEVLITRCAPSDVQALDFSEAQIAYARTRAAAKLAQFRTANAQELPFANATFDAAAMALVISFLPDPAKAVAEMARVVRPGGWVATYMWDIMGGGLPQEPIRIAMQSMGMNAPYPSGSEASRLADMRAFWERDGLRDVETRQIGIQLNYSDFDDFWTSSTAVASPTAKLARDLPPADRERLKTRLREQLPKDAQGRISYGARANAVKGRVPD
jgi:SAM-dependent methyltransferase